MGGVLTNITSIVSTYFLLAIVATCSPTPSTDYIIVIEPLPATSTPDESSRNNDKLALFLRKDADPPQQGH